jgi:hypothetical protein
MAFDTVSGFLETCTSVAAPGHSPDAPHRSPADIRTDKAFCAILCGSEDYITCTSGSFLPSSRAQDKDAVKGRSALARSKRGAVAETCGARLPNLAWCQFSLTETVGYRFAFVTCLEDKMIQVVEASSVIYIRVSVNYELDDCGTSY